MCHMGTECMPVYDYLQFGSGPPGSTGTQAFMMGWLVPGIIGQTNQTPQGSDLYCTEQDCMAQSGCSAYSGMDYGWRCKEGWKPGIGGTCVQGTQNNPGPFAYKQDCLNSGCEPISIDPKDTKIVTPFTIDPLSKITEPEGNEIEPIKEGVKLKGKLMERLRMATLAGIKGKGKK